MKKLLSFLAAASLVLAIVLIVAKPSTAHAQPGGSIGNACLQAGVSQGDCAKYLATMGPSVCGLNDHGVEGWTTFGFKNKGECVSAVQQYVRDNVNKLPLAP